MAVIAGRSIMAQPSHIKPSLRSLFSTSHTALVPSAIMARDSTDESTSSALTSKLVFVLLALILAATLAAGILFLIRRHKQKSSRRDSLPSYQEHDHHSRSQHRRHGARSEPSHVQQEKERLMSESDGPRDGSPVPEIRVTLPEELDEAGKSQSGRTVVVHVGDSTVGFAPYQSNLPSYQQSEADRFDSLDIDRIGGLKEKEHL